MKNWKDAVIRPDKSIRDGMELLEKSALQIVFVTDESFHLLGIVTDGDCRRGLLQGFKLDDFISFVMNTNPIICQQESLDYAIELMREQSIKQIPIVDEQGVIVGLEYLEKIIMPIKRDNAVALMAGGMGTRLHPLTQECPKPLLTVGDRPIIETIIMNLKEHGFSKFYICVNYKAEMIKSHLGDGKAFNIDIEYIDEEERLGTVGALHQLSNRIVRPLLVMNGDLLTKINYTQLMDFHSSNQAEATMCVREYGHQIPYGVVMFDKDELTSIEEKPTYSFFINAGIYILNPMTLVEIPKNTFFDMTDLFKKLIAQERKTSAFPIREYWLDIGHLDDYHKANGDFFKVF